MSFARCAVFLLRKIQIFAHFIQFPHTEMTQIIKTLLMEDQALIVTKSIVWLLMTWRHKEPRHQ